MISAGFRPFFLVSAFWAAIAIPLWIAAFGGEGRLPIVLPPVVWHVHEMVFGFGAATVAGFLLTAIPNWTGRLPVQGGPLAMLVLLWFAGRIATLFATSVGPVGAAALDLAFPLAFIGVVAREIVAGRNWRNLPMVVALGLLFAGNLLVHCESIGVAMTAEVGNRLGVATLLMLISLVGGRTIPSFTRNWLVKQRPGAPAPTAYNGFDRIVLGITAVTLVFWTFVPENIVTHWACLVAGTAHCLRLSRWRGFSTLREPLLWVLHLGYGWLGLGFLLLGFDALMPWLPQTTALHALTVGAVGTMTLAVMTRATLGHTGRPVVAGPGTVAIFGLVTMAATVRLLAPLGGAQHYMFMLSLAGAAWSGAFGLFALLYLGPLASRRVERAPTAVSVHEASPST